MDPQTLPSVLSHSAEAKTGEEREIDLAEIVGLPDFDVSNLFLYRLGELLMRLGSSKSEAYE